MNAIRTSLAAVFLSVACSVVFVGSSLAQTQQQPTWLRAGATWQYFVSQYNQAKPKGIEAVVHTVTAESTADMPDGSQLHQLRVDRGSKSVVTFEVWSVRDGSIVQLATDSLLRRGVLTAGAAPMQIWQRDAAVEEGGTRRWQWRGPLLGADVGSGNLAGEAGLGEWQHKAESLGEESVSVPAGIFKAEHIRIRSEQPDRDPFLRDVWLVPEIGVVCEERRYGKSVRKQRLKKFTAGKGPDTERVIQFLEKCLKDGHVPAFNNTPRVTWLPAGPEALMIAGRIATVHTDSFRSNYLVARDRIVAFGISGKNGLAGAAYAAFDSKTAIPTKQVSLRALALLLARAEAALLQFGNVRAVPLTLAPTITLRQEPRMANAQITGGALDGAQRNIAVWLSFGNRWQYHMATDIPPPAEASKDR